MAGGDVPLLVCISADVSVRERVVRRLNDLGPLVICADLAELRAMLFPPTMLMPVTVPPLPAAGGGTGPVETTPAITVPESAIGPELKEIEARAAVGNAASASAGASLTASELLRLGDLTVEPDEHRVTWREEPLALTRLERKLLARLASPPVTVWSYERLFASVWGGAYLGDTAILHSAVKRLRRKLRAVESGPQIQTVRGVGYRLAVPQPASR